LIADQLASPSDRENFCMSGFVFKCHNLVRSFGDSLIVTSNHASEWKLTSRRAFPRELDATSHHSSVNDVKV